MIPVIQYPKGLHQLYREAADAQSRFERLKREFRSRFGRSPVAFVSAPGRVELIGNHTDHNGGRVLAAAVNPDMIAAFAPCSEPSLEVYAREFSRTYVIELSELYPIRSEKGATAALLRGIAAGIRQAGETPGGFQAVVHSHIGVGSGLSSSAAFEMVIAAIFNYLYQNNQMPPEQLAKIGQFAENHYFGKPCGLMDQLACALGGILHIDFKNRHHPVWQPLPDALKTAEYSLAIVHTGGNHADLTTAYAAIPEDMRRVAAFFGAEVLREVPFPTFREKLSALREAVGDRAVLRAWHFFQENERVGQQVAALTQSDLTTFLKQIQESGNSSFKYLQNVVLPSDAHHQALAIALAICEQWAEKHGGACRVHGGGFAGTILAVIPEGQRQSFAETLTPVLGERAVMFPEIRHVGVAILVP